MKYVCDYLSGGGTWHYNGEWDLTETPAYFIFKTDDDDYEIMNSTTMRLVKDMTKLRHGGNPYEIDDGEFIVYPAQCGTPYVFKPVTPVEHKPSNAGKQELLF